MEITWLDNKYDSFGFVGKNQVCAISLIQEVLEVQGKKRTGFYRLIFVGKYSKYPRMACETRTIAKNCADALINKNNKPTNILQFSGNRIKSLGGK